MQVHGAMRTLMRSRWPRPPQGWLLPADSSQATQAVLVSDGDARCSPCIDAAGQVSSGPSSLVRGTYRGRVRADDHDILRRLVSEVLLKCWEDVLKEHLDVLVDADRRAILRPRLALPTYFNVMVSSLLVRRGLDIVLPRRLGAEGLCYGPMKYDLEGPLQNTLAPSAVAQATKIELPGHKI